MSTNRYKLYVVFGFHGTLLRDTLANSASEAKRRCVRSLRENHTEYENVGWPTIAKWGWKCVPIILTLANQKQGRRSR